jgi:hypothetical protein
MNPLTPRFKPISKFFAAASVHDSSLPTYETVYVSYLFSPTPTECKIYYICGGIRTLRKCVCVAIGYGWSFVTLTQRCVFL